MLLGAAGNDRLRHVVTRAPLSREVVRRFVAGDTVSGALTQARKLHEAGHLLSFDYLGAPAVDRVSGAEEVQRLRDLLGALATEGLAEGSEISLSVLEAGLLIDRAAALENAGEVCRAAAEVGAFVTLEMQTHQQVDRTLAIVRTLRERFPQTGIALQSYLHRTEGDIAGVLQPGSRVRLVKGTHEEPESVAYESRHEIDLSFVRCLNLLMSGDGLPVIGTHDPRLVAIAKERAAWHGRSRSDFEFQMVYGVAPGLARSLVEAGYQVRVRVPYGEQWYGYFMRRMAERPANLLTFARAIARA
ncbi:proline dehydrogenase family protein [Epidermidibacterium keratini]